MKRLLIVAYHFPPEGSSSGVLRTLKFSKYLPQHGWAPHVLTLNESLYPVQDRELLKDVPPAAVVHRTWALDAARHLAVKGRYPSAFGVPDRFVSWVPFGFLRGRAVVKRAGIQALYSTSPVPTAHLIAGALKLTTGLPWIADFRDPWIEEGAYPPPGSLRYRVEARLEAFVMRHASRVTVTTDHLRREILGRYPSLAPERVTAVFNGYDEEDFAHLELSAAGPSPDRFEILHTGLVTPEYRDPFPLLRAVRVSVSRGLIDRKEISIAFLGGGDYLSSDQFVEGIRELGLADVVRVHDRLPYRLALQRMTEAAVLLLLQASDDTRNLIPAKAFEYLRTRRPILALTPEGATADLVRACDAGLVADPRDPEQVERALLELHARWREKPSLPAGIPPAVRRFERVALAGELAFILNTLTDPGSACTARSTGYGGPHHDGALTRATAENVRHEPAIVGGMPARPPRVTRRNP